MSNLKSLITLAVVLGSVLVQQSAGAYPRTSKKSEINYLKSVLALYFGQPMPHLDRELESKYRNKSDELKTVLISGYQMCDEIQAANQQGISGQALLAEEVYNLNGGAIHGSSRSYTERDLILYYNSTKKYLCPELF